MRILVMTSVYPSPSDNKNHSITPVVHYFCKQWLKEGHEVIVIFNANQYPFLFSILPRKLRKYLMSKFSFIPLANEKNNNLIYNLEGIKVFKFSLLKIIPHGRFFSLQIKKQTKKIISSLETERFKPDVILSHWDNPQLQISEKLKKHYQVPTALTFHGLSNLTNKLYGKNYRNKLNNIDLIGFRSLKMQEDFHNLFDGSYKEFLCYSGIPDDYVKNSNTFSKTFNKKVTKYIYVGSLIQRKNPDVIIKALAMHKGINFELNIVGEGPMKEELLLLAENLDVKKNVKFHGHKSREEVMNLMSENEVFTMVSKNEVFGLVYLEAMLQGCIVVCSKDGGFDGIIKDQENGFICEQGNAEELASVYSTIDSISGSKKEKISSEAIFTSKKYTDSRVAHDYLQNIMPLLRN